MLSGELFYYYLHGFIFNRFDSMLDLKTAFLQNLLLAISLNHLCFFSVIMYVLLPMPLLFFAGSDSTSLFSESDNRYTNLYIGLRLFVCVCVCVLVCIYTNEHGYQSQTRGFLLIAFGVCVCILQEKMEAISYSSFQVFYIIQNSCELIKNIIFFCFVYSAGSVQPSS